MRRTPDQLTGMKPDPADPVRFKFARHLNTMLGVFRLCFFKPDSADRERTNRKPYLIFLVVGFVALSAICSSSFGQEAGSEPRKPAAESDDGATSEDLLAAMKSLDETLNKADVLAERRQMRNRLVGFGVLGGAGLALLGVLFGYLRLDHATRGFHSGRLQLLAAFFAILILATCYFLWTQVLFK